MTDNSIKRSCCGVVVEVTWPRYEGSGWDDLPAHARNSIRDHMDAAADLLMAALP